MLWHNLYPGIWLLVPVLAFAVAAWLLLDIHEQLTPQLYKRAASRDIKLALLVVLVVIFLVRVLP